MHALWTPQGSHLYQRAAIQQQCLLGPPRLLEQRCQLPRRLARQQQHSHWTRLFMLGIKLRQVVLHGDGCHLSGDEDNVLVRLRVAAAVGPAAVVSLTDFGQLSRQDN